MNRYSTFLFVLITCTVTGQASAIDDNVKMAYIEAGKEKAVELRAQKRAELSKLESELEEIGDRSRVLR